MAIIRPFRAMRYGPDAGAALAHLISPPGAGRIYPRTGLHGIHPYNILRLVRGRFDPLNTPDLPPYDSTRRLMQAWKRQGVLIRDPVPALYLLEQEFEFGGDVQTRRGIVALIHLEPLGKRSLFAHERTVAGPKPDILDQVRALQANLSLTLGLVDDPGGDLQKLLGDAPRGGFLNDVVDGQAVRNRTIAITSTDFIDAVTRRLAGQSIVIADGHHRYESALMYQRQVRRLESPRGAHPADYVMMLLVPTEDADRSILPAHRVLRGLPDGWDAALDADLGRFFQLTPMDSAEQLTQFLARGRLPRHGLVLADRQIGLRLRKSQRVARVMRQVPGPWRDLEIAPIRAVLLRQVLGVDPDTYITKETALFPSRTEEVVDAVRVEGYQLGILMRPARATVVTALARRGHVMPPKSTHFYPKPAKGLLMNSLKGF